MGSQFWAPNPSGPRGGSPKQISWCVFLLIIILIILIIVIIVLFGWHRTELSGKKKKKIDCQLLGTQSVSASRWVSQTNILVCLSMIWLAQIRVVWVKEKDASPTFGRQHT